MKWATVRLNWRNTLLRLYLCVRATTAKLLRGILPRGCWAWGVLPRGCSRTIPVLTLIGCCLASLTQGWDQTANGNLGWPRAMGLSALNVVHPGAHDTWTFGLVNSLVRF